MLAETAQVALTFDDGPDPVWTPQVAAALDDVDARATFFVMAPRALAHPRVLEALVEAGHEVELHCGRHLRHTETPREAIERDTYEALEALCSLGISPRRWRVPWGVPAPWTEEIAAARGLELVHWSLDTHDWRGDPAPAMLAAVAPGLDPDAVILMHDGIGPGARRDGCEETVSLLGTLAAEAGERGLECGPLGGQASRTAPA